MQFYFTYRGFEKEPTRFWDWECIMWYLYYIILKYEYRTGIKLKAQFRQFWPSDCENILDILWWKCTSIEADNIYPLTHLECAGLLGSVMAEIIGRISAATDRQISIKHKHNLPILLVRWALSTDQHFDGAYKGLVLREWKSSSLLSFSSILE